MKGIVDSVASFQMLVTVNMSKNPIGTDGLDTLIKSLAGSPVETLDLSGCNIVTGISPLKQARECKRLKNLDLSDNLVGYDDAGHWKHDAETLEVLEVLLDNKYPRIRDLNLNDCGITDDIVEEVIAPFLSRNRTLRYLKVQKNKQGLRQGSGDVGERGVAALRRAVHDTSSFQNTLASNHFIYKIMASGGALDSKLFATCVHNYHGSNNKDSRYRIAWGKHLDHFFRHGSADMSPFMDMDIRHVPHFLCKLAESRIFCGFGASPLNIMYKLFSCKMYREKIKVESQVIHLQATNSTLSASVDRLENAHAITEEKAEHLKNANSKLQDENKRLREQLAKLALQKSNNQMAEPETGSIAERVKTRSMSRKRGRKS